MKNLIKFAVIAVICLLLVKTGQTLLSAQTTKDTQVEYQLPQESEEDSFPYDQEFFLRELSQKSLPPLTEKEKRIWPFKLAKSPLFL
jgi:hypothetical protein